MKSKAWVQVTVGGYWDVEGDDEEKLWADWQAKRDLAILKHNIGNFVVVDVADIQLMDFEDPREPDENTKEHTWVLEARHYTRDGLIEEYSCHVCGEERKEVYTK